MMGICAARQQHLQYYAFAGGTVCWTFVLLFVCNGTVFWTFIILFVCCFVFFVVCSDFAGYENTADTILQFSREKRMNVL